jgi:ABC-2 type transport system ATP-binding protein
MIEVKNLSKYYGRFLALNDVSFKVGKGEVIGLLGPNGAGKTTTMKIMTGFLPATSGDVVIGGTSVQSDSLYTRSLIGYLPETNPLYTDMTVESFLQFIAEVRAIAKNLRKQAIHKMVETCMLEQVFYKPINALSKGYRQRVGLAQALIHDPAILILDEPTSGLDPNQIREMLELIRTIGKAKTVLHSTHILSEAQETCDRVLILAQGKLVANDAPKKLAAKAKGHSIHVAVTGNNSELASALAQLPEVKQCAVISQEGEYVKAELVNPGDCRGKVCEVLQSNHWFPTRLEYIEPGLDELFAELTGGKTHA